MTRKLLRQQKEIGLPDPLRGSEVTMGDIYTHPISSINWRTSLVPAPAVIPAPRAYINAVAVKGFVVELRVAKERFRPIRF